MKYLLHGEETERLHLRVISPDDFDAWLVFHKDPNTSLYWKSEKGTPEEECSKWYAKQQWRYDNDMGGMNALVEKSSGLLAGHCGLLIQQVDGRTEMEIAYSLLPAFWGRGYATEAAIKCRDTAFAKHYAGSLISIISVTNLSSEKVALNTGMHKHAQTVYNGNEVNIFRINKAG
jgi:[ribosomal protein S5]-alanine N-acetyltransferase